MDSNTLVPISEAKGRLAALVRESADNDVLLMRHGRPAAVMVGHERYEAMIERYLDMADRLAVLEHDPDEPTVDADRLFAELGLDEKSEAS